VAEPPDDVDDAAFAQLTVKSNAAATPRFTA
jgi:hypothetical protein